jgi:hypothetical protein
MYGRIMKLYEVDKWIRYFNEHETGVILNDKKISDLLFLLKYMKHEIQEYIEVFAEECRLEDK